MHLSICGTRQPTCTHYWVFVAQDNQHVLTIGYLWHKTTNMYSLLAICGTRQPTCTHYWLFVAQDNQHVLTIGYLWHKTTNMYSLLGICGTRQPTCTHYWVSMAEHDEELDERSSPHVTHVLQQATKPEDKTTYKQLKSLKHILCYLIHVYIKVVHRCTGGRGEEGEGGNAVTRTIPLAIVGWLWRHQAI